MPTTILFGETYEQAFARRMQEEAQFSSCIDKMEAGYAYLKSVARPSDEGLRLSGWSWIKFAEACGISTLEDTLYFRAIRERGWMTFHQIPGTYGDGYYILNH